MSNIDRARVSLAQQAKAMEQLDRGDARGCEGIAPDEYMDLLPTLSKQERLNLAKEAKQKHPILFAESDMVCTKTKGGDWKISQGGSR